MKRKNHLVTVLTIFLFTINSFTYSQGCLPEGIDFSTQEDIDNFQANYPGCTEIEGDVTIWGTYTNDDIMNLNGLNVLTSIGGTLKIKGTDSLKILTGLENLETIGNELIIRENLSLTTLTGLENLATIGGELIIRENLSLTNLTGLENLNHIGGEMSIVLNDALTSLNGLGNLNYVGDDIGIAANEILINLDHLENLTNITGDLNISYNPSLKSLMGLHNVTNISGTLFLYGGCLTDLTGLNNLTSIGFDLKIWDMEANLIGLNNLTTVWGSCSITSNDSLSSLEVLNNLNFIGGDFEISYNESLVSLTGLDNLTTISGAFLVYENDSLINLAGLENLINLGGSLHIGSFFHDQYGQVFGLGNPAMTNLTGLNNLESIDGSLYVISNPVLNDLSALENLTTVHNITIGKHSYLNECGNPSLTNLYGLQNINPNIIGNVYIGYNNSLSTCDISSICEYLATTTNTVEIVNNATGCNSPYEVEAACLVKTNEISDSENKIQIFPNPAKNDINILCSKNIQIKEVCIYNQTGKKLVCKKGSNKTIDVSMLQPGLYFIEVVTASGSFRKKLIIE